MSVDDAKLDEPPLPSVSYRVDRGSAVARRVHECAQRPGAPLERDGTSPVITDPGGVADDLTDQVSD